MDVRVNLAIPSCLLDTSRSAAGRKARSEDTVLMVKPVLKARTTTSRARTLLIITLADRECSTVALARRGPRHGGTLRSYTRARSIR